MVMASDGALEQSYAVCRRIMQQNASSFTLACRLLPTERRRATVALYGVFRTLDDLVDEVGDGHLERDAALASLNLWRAWFCAPDSRPPDSPVLPAFLDTVQRFDIPLDYFVHLADGLLCDVHNRRYADFAELALYCYRVASTVGLAMCSVLGVTDARAASSAAELGVAMQLTNILRDVREDVGMGRVYLPEDELRAAGWDAERLLRGAVDPAFCALMERQVTRARSYYARGSAGLGYISPDARFAILVAARVYGGILTEIERRRYDVFGGRAHVSTPTKLRLVATGYLQRRRLIGDGTGAGVALGPGEPSGAELISAAGTSPPTWTLTTPGPAPSA